MIHHNPVSNETTRLYAPNHDDVITSTTGSITFNLQCTVIYSHHSNTQQTGEYLRQKKFKLPVTENAFKF